MCILDLSKVLLYEFQYDHIKNKYVNKSRLLFTDTDSLMYELKTEDIYEDFSKNKEIFDFSNFSDKSKYYDDSNKLVGGKMKYETDGVAIEEFAGLKPKMYSLLVDYSYEHKIAKGVNKNVIARISHSEYKLRHSITRIQNKNHRMGTYDFNKISLQFSDDKMHILNHTYNRLALSY